MLDYSNLSSNVSAETPSRKREREISQEPMTPSVDSHSQLDGETPSSPRASSSRSSRPSPKKGRLFGPGSLAKTTEEEQQDLDPTESANHPSGSTTAEIVAEKDDGEKHTIVIPVSGSLTNETKMRQVSEGVRGVEPKKTRTGDDSRVVTSTPFPTTEDAAHEEKVPNPDEPSTSVTDSTVPDRAPTPPGTTISISEPSGVVDDPPAPLDRPKRSSVDYLLPFPSTKKESDSSGEQEKGLKRKLGDRAVSESREAEFVGKKASKKDIADAATASAVGTKRSRDEEDKDPNPKEAKRPSPPPESTVKAAVEKPPVASSSMVGFMAYANVSPFMSPRKSSTSESSKRPREDADEDANPREAKRPSPPPDKKQVEESKPISSSGFLAFASTKSPFAPVKGPNVFGITSTKTTAPPSPSPSPWSSGVRTPLTPSHDQTRPVFGSTSSPYVRSGSPGPAFGRSNSPSSRKLHTVGSVNKNTSAFSAYATNGFSGFSPAPKVTKTVEETVKKRQGSSNGSEKSDEEDGSDEKEGMSFSERLRTQKDDQGSGEDEKPTLQEQEVVTGEEDEETVYQVRGKLFALSEQNQWSERGIGLLKLNVRRTDGKGARLVMRKDAVFTVLLNATLFKGMKCSYAPQDQRFLRFSTFDQTGSPTHYNLKLASAKIAGELLEEITDHIP